MRDNSHSLGVAPDTLPPQLLRQDNRPHGFFASLAVLGSEIGHLGLALVASELSIDSSFDHAKKHGLHGVVELVILGTQVGGLDVVQDGFPNEDSEI